MPCKAQPNGKVLERHCQYAMMSKSIEFDIQGRWGIKRQTTSWEKDTVDIVSVRDSNVTE